MFRVEWLNVEIPVSAAETGTEDTQYTHLSQRLSLKFLGQKMILS